MEFISLDKKDGKLTGKINVKINIPEIELYSLMMVECAKNAVEEKDVEMVAMLNNILKEMQITLEKTNKEYEKEEKAKAKK